MGAKSVALIEKKRIVDEVTALKKKMKMNKACETLGVSVPTYWNYRKALKRAGMFNPNKVDKTPKIDPLMIPKESNPVIKVFLQDATFALTEGSFRIEEGQMRFEGKGFIKIDNK